MRSDWDKVAGDARRVLEGNRQRGVSAWAGQRYDFVCPSPTTYPFQWFWDSAFHAIALVREVLPRIRSFFRWLKAYRDPDDDGLVAIIQPDESGLDASPKYDRLMGITHDPPEQTHPQLRRSMKRLFDAYAPYRSDPARIPALDVFTWEDVMVNAIYADGLRCLAKLTDLAREADEFNARAGRVRAALEAECWDDKEGVFWDLDGWDEEPAKTLTFSSLFPLILVDLDPAKAKRVIDEHLLNEREFWLPYPVPSVAATEPSFDPKWRTDTTWRGPTWINVNWYLYWGLRAHGRADVASDLAERTVRMMASGGVREFYDPLTGEGEGARDFGWSTLVLDLIAAERGSA